MSDFTRNILASLNTQILCVTSFPLSGSVVSASDDGYVTNWESGAQCWRRYHEGVTTVAVSPVGTHVVSGTFHGDLQLWDANSGVPHASPWMLHNGRVWSLCWSPDGGRIASCSADDTFVICTSSTGEVICECSHTGHYVVRAIAYCPKGGRIATSGHDSTIRIWDDTTGVLQVTLPIQTEAVPSSEQETVPSVSWTTDGNKVISGSIDGTVRMWDILRGEMLWVLSAHVDSIHYIAVSKHVFATASADNTVRLWNLETHGLIGSSDLPSPNGDHDEARCVALAADENVLIAGTKNGTIYTFDIEDIVSGMRAGTLNYYTRLARQYMQSFRQYVMLA